MKLSLVVYIVFATFALVSSCEPPDCDRPDCGSCGKRKYNNKDKY